VLVDATGKRGLKTVLKSREERELRFGDMLDCRYTTFFVGSLTKELIVTRIGPE
jgi:hypothetical protein